MWALLLGWLGVSDFIPYLTTILCIADKRKINIIIMPDILFLKRSQPLEWLYGNRSVPFPVTVTLHLHGQDGQVSGVPLAFLVADSPLFRSMLLTHADAGFEKHITLESDLETISCYVSLLCSGWMQMDEIG